MRKTQNQFRDLNHDGQYMYLSKLNALLKHSTTWNHIKEPFICQKSSFDEIHTGLYRFEEWNLLHLVQTYEIG